MAELLIPVAVELSSGLAVQPHEVVEGGAYACPGCQEGVVWRRASEGVRRAHFAHRAEQSCTGEGAIHRGAKLLVLRQVQSYLGGRGPRPVVAYPCSECGEPREPVPMPRVDEVALEGDRELS